jgi:WD40 repeat protein
MEATEFDCGLIRVHGQAGSVVGGACLVGRDLALTCAHVVEDALGGKLHERPTEPIQIDFSCWQEHGKMEASVLQDGWFPPDRERDDVAILRLHGDPPAEAGHPPLLRPPSMIDHRFRVHGFPAGIGDAWATGVIRGSTHGGHWVQLESVEVPGHRVERGFSGAPVWDEQAEAVVGIVVVTETDPAVQAARMIPIAALARLWPALEEHVGWRLRFEREELRRHWEPKARGLKGGSRRDAPWLFTGRVRAMQELVAWLDPKDRRPGMIVTGGPGSGKSAVISRLVTLADPRLRSDTPTESATAGTLPPDGAIDVALHAKGRTLDFVSAKLGLWLDLAARTADDLVSELVERERPCTIVLDALDEAVDPIRIATQLLQPLASQGRDIGIKVLVGTRRGPNGMLLRKLAALPTLDLDDPDAYLENEDLVAYVHSCLLAHAPRRRSPYVDHTVLAAHVAEAVARRASPSFLLAQLTSDALVDAGEPVDTSKPDWERCIPSDVPAAMEEYLSRFGEHETRVRDLFRALAFAEGSGLPRGESLWAALAEAIARRRCTDDDVAWLLDSPAADYLLEGEGERGVFRLYHEELADHLRGQDEGEQREVHAQIVDTLLRRLPQDGGGRRDWQNVGPYTRAHMATHAAKSGGLDALIEDPGFLLAAEPARLVRAIPRAQASQAQLLARVYRRAAAQMRDCDVREAASYLELHALKAGALQLARAVHELQLPRRWTTRWVQWLARDAYLAIGQHGADISAIATHELDGIPIAISGGDDGAVRIWSLSGCQPLSPPLRAHEGRVSAIATGVLDEDPIAVSGGWDNTLRIWDLRSGTQLGDPLTGHESAVTQIAVGVLDGAPIAVSAGWDNTLRIWDLRQHAPLGRPIRAHHHGAAAVALGHLHDRPIAISGGYETVRLWDLRHRCQLQDHALQRHLGGVTAVAVGELEGVPIAISGGWDQELWAWDLDAYAPLWDRPIGRHGGGVTAVAFGAREGVVVSGSEDGTVRTWDLRSGRSEAIDVGGAVFAVATANIEGEAVAVCGGEGGSVRVWELQAGSQTQAPEELRRGRLTCLAMTPALAGRPALVAYGGDDGTVSVCDANGSAISSLEVGSPVFALAASRLRRREVLLTGDWSGAIRVWDAYSGVEMDGLLGVHDGWVAALDVVEVDGRPILASAGADGCLRLWDLDRREQSMEIRASADTLTAVRITMIAGAPVAITAGADRSVQAFNLVDRRRAPTLLGRHDDEALAVAVGTVGGMPVAASAGLDGAVRVWDLSGRRPRLDPLRGRSESVTAVALMQGAGRPLVLGGGNEGLLQIWDLDSRAAPGLVDRAAPNETAFCIELGSALAALADGGEAGCLAACASGLAAIDLDGVPSPEHIQAGGAGASPFVRRSRSATGVGEQHA